MNNELKEKIFDVILAEALKECLDEKLKEYDELVANSPPHEFSPEFEKKMKKIKNSIGREDRIKKYKRIAVRSIVSVAAAFGLIFGVLLTQPEVSAAVQNVIRTVFNQYDKYDYVGEELTVDNFNNNIRLGYVPDGYYLSKGDYSPAVVSLEYLDENENKIMFDYGIADGSSSIYDNEHNSYSNFTINGIEYHYYESNDKDFYNMLVWYKDGYSFGIFAHLSKKELVKIAENVK
ncbi:MAG: DUF4367 domain-containing protein [Eubacterium sp.]|nr:DUF4367 domain-containing protein [Eubacterium sp.]